MSSTAGQIIFWLFIVVGALLLYKFLVNPAGKNSSQLSYGELVAKVEKGDIRSMTVKQSEVVAV
ncbi:MAG TPA: ATP-dependent metallopeptidase FtsH/Yme1/Tma family protein, partial [Pyrinomonadaceae bacterium]|nr:ATP-dependent metallopeptidase FtsH/Yme1/Tma family protein [Pyrinomonadaceae bacterium]